MSTVSMACGAYDDGVLCTEMMFMERRWGLRCYDFMTIINSISSDLV